MNTEFRESFLDDLRRVRVPALKERVKEIIARVEAARTLRDVPNVKKLHGGGDCYRVRMGVCRLGLVLNGDSVTFVRFLPRKDLYRYFP